VKPKYTLAKLYDGVYYCKINNMYDLTMTFCRVQEFYESPFKAIRGKKFTLVDFMKIYSKANGNFTYPLDWGGFNVPGPVIADLYAKGIDDYNIYDSIIEDIHNSINEKLKQKNHYYLIGANNNKTTIEHEVCHAFYFLDQEYKKKVNKELSKLDRKVYKKMTDVLLNIGYNKVVLLDELQAYLITDSSLIDDNIKLNKKELLNKTDVVLELKHFYKKYKKSVDSK